MFENGWMIFYFPSTIPEHEHPKITVLKLTVVKSPEGFNTAFKEITCCTLKHYHT